MEGKQYIKVLQVISMEHISSVFLVKHEEHTSRHKYGSVAVPEKLNSGLTEQYYKNSRIVHVVTYLSMLEIICLASAKSTKFNLGCTILCLPGTQLVVSLTLELFTQELVK